MKTSENGRLKTSTFVCLIKPSLSKGGLGAFESDTIEKGDRHVWLHHPG